jgi:23S rRNA pseudouridine2604 synthase
MKFMENIYPMRINKYLAHKNIATRREADELIKKGLVFINGKKALLGDKVGTKDKVEVKGKKIKEYKYFAYYKPTNTITHSPNEKEVSIKEKISNYQIPQDVFPLGRLDKASHGLIILTNDGRITEGLLSPENAHEKEYVVKTKEKLRSNFKEKMEKGVNIEGYVTKKCKVTIINENTFRVTLTEGKKHQIRRMCANLFQEVDDLKRVRILNIKLGNLKANQYREIQGEELQEFLAQVLK